MRWGFRSVLAMNTLHAGDTIENRVTGERLVFRETSRENGAGGRVIGPTAGGATFPWLMRGPFAGGMSHRSDVYQVG